MVETTESMPVTMVGEYRLEFERMGTLEGSFVIEEAASMGVICDN